MSKQLLVFDFHLKVLWYILIIFIDISLFSYTFFNCCRIFIKPTLINFGKPFLFFITIAFIYQFINIITIEVKQLF